MGAVAKSYYEEGLPNIWGNAQIFSHIWGSSSLNMTLQLLPSGFPYIWRKFGFLFFQGSHTVCTATKIPFLCIPFLGIARPQSQFPHSCVSESDLNISRIGPHIFLQLNRKIEYINRSQTHECGNWDCGGPIPFLGIFVLNFRYCFFCSVSG